MPIWRKEGWWPDEHRPGPPDEEPGTEDHDDGKGDSLTVSKGGRAFELGRIPEHATEMRSKFREASA
jgi:hypothetical protein